MAEMLIETIGLKKYFKTSGGLLHAVDDVSLQIPKGTTTGIVGESGCGKSTLGRVILRLLEATEGQVLYRGNDILKLGANETRKMREQLQIIFQDPYASLNPRMCLSEIIAEPIVVSGMLKKKKDIQQRVEGLMETVGLAERLTYSYPHELDGGRRQRIGIARALSVNPEFIVCDEPVSSLDVSIQAQILNLMMDLQQGMGLTYMFITHDLSVVKHISDEIVVMYLGQVVEKTTSSELFKNPLHPYTQALLKAIPEPNLKNRNAPRDILKGEVTSPISPSPACRFSQRCKYCMERCKESPTLKDVGAGHQVACWLHE